MTINYYEACEGCYIEQMCHIRGALVKKNRVEERCPCMDCIVKVVCEGTCNTISSYADHLLDSGVKVEKS